jgi:hypothetical protein
MIARVRNSIVVGTRYLLNFLWDSLKLSLRALTTLIFLAVIPSVILPLILRPFNLYFDVRETIVEWGKLAHVVIKKSNALTLMIGHSDSVAGLRDEYELQWADKDYVGTWFAVVNPDTDAVYKNVRLFIQFDDRQASKVSIKQEKRWIMFKHGHFNFEVGEIGQQMLVQTEQIQLQFREKGNYPFRYVIYADGYTPATGALLLRVK